MFEIHFFYNFFREQHNYPPNGRSQLDARLASIHHNPHQDRLIPNSIQTSTEPCDCAKYPNQYPNFGKCYCNKPNCNCKHRKKFPTITQDNINSIYDLLRNKYHHPKEDIDKMFRIAQANPGITTEKLLQNIHQITTEKVAQTNRFRPTQHNLEFSPAIRTKPTTQRNLEYSSPAIRMNEVQVPIYQSELDRIANLNQKPPQKSIDLDSIDPNGVYILQENRQDLNFLPTNLPQSENPESVSYFNHRPIDLQTNTYEESMETYQEEISTLALKRQGSHEAQDEPFNTFKPKPLANYLHYLERPVTESSEESDEFVALGTENTLITQDMVANPRLFEQQENEFTRFMAMKHKAPLEKVVVLEKLRPLMHSRKNGMLIDRANVQLEKPKQEALDPSVVQQLNGFNFEESDELVGVESQDVFSSVSSTESGLGLNSLTENYGFSPTDLRTVRVGLPGLEPRVREMDQVQDNGKIADMYKFLSAKPILVSSSMRIKEESRSKFRVIQKLLNGPLYTLYLKEG